MSIHDVTPEIIRRECARMLHRSVFETLNDAYQAITVEHDCLRDAIAVSVTKDGRRDGMLIDKDHLSWSLDDIFRRHSMQDLIFGFWSLPMQDAAKTAAWNAGRRDVT